MQDPITGQELKEEDLVEVKTSKYLDLEYSASSLRVSRDESLLKNYIIN